MSLSRLISGVSIPRSSRDFTKLSSNEMLNVFESGESKQVGQMFQQFGDQFGGASPDEALPYHDAAKQAPSRKVNGRRRAQLGRSHTAAPIHSGRGLTHRSSSIKADV
ncbi:MAG: hypothetical protein HND48_17475 [Chloroflexi bacterium]|nr:hypothetical protein [Chloroflexota bacterium]